MPHTLAPPPLLLCSRRHLLLPPPPTTSPAAMDNLAWNGFQRRSLLQMEAILLAQAGYPCPPDTRPPHDWVLSNDGVPVPPAPKEGTIAFDLEVEAARAQMTPEERANPAGN